MIKNSLEDTLHSIIKVLETLDIYKELDIVYNFTAINTFDGVKIKNNLNDFIESNTISLLEKQYLDSDIREISSAQLSALETLITNLENLTEKEIKNLKPESLLMNTKIPFTDIQDEKLIKTLRGSMRLLSDFLLKLIDQGYDYPQINKTADLLQDRFELIESIVENEVQAIFVSKLKDLIEKRGLSQIKLAKMLGLRQASVNDWFTFKSKPSVARMVEVAVVLNTSIDYLIRPDAPETDLSTISFAKETGLAVESIEKLKALKKDISYNKYAAKTLDTLIQNYHNFKPDTDVLYGITEYLKEEYEKGLYVISNEEFTDFTERLLEECNNCNDVKEVRQKINDFTNFIQRDLQTSRKYDVSDIQLLNITKALIRIKDTF